MQKSFSPNCAIKHMACISISLSPNLCLPNGPHVFITSDHDRAGPGGEFRNSDWFTWFIEIWLKKWQSEGRRRIPALLGRRGWGICRLEQIQSGGQNEDDEHYDNYDDDDDDNDSMGSTRFVKAGSKTTIESVSMLKQNY